MGLSLSLRKGEKVFVGDDFVQLDDISHPQDPDRMTAHFLVPGPKGQIEANPMQIDDVIQVGDTQIKFLGKPPRGGGWFTFAFEAPRDVRIDRESERLAKDDRAAGPKGAVKGPSGVRFGVRTGQRVIVQPPDTGDIRVKLSAVHGDKATLFISAPEGERDIQVEKGKPVEIEYARPNSAEKGKFAVTLIQQQPTRFADKSSEHTFSFCAPQEVRIDIETTFHRREQARQEARRQQSLKGETLLSK